jgi:tRNA pseudouridine38-40 synthase
MNEAASLLVGLRDFASFCRKRERATTIRTLIRCSFSRTDDGLVVATVEADAFCHSMVRSIVGALLDVGQGRHEPAWTLEEIVYPPDEDLPAQAERTRRRRA